MNCLFRVESGVDLAKTIQQKTNEQVETTDKIVQNAFKRHEQNLIDNLKQSEYSIKSVIASHEEAIKDRLNKLSTYTTMMGGGDFRDINHPVHHSSPSQLLGDKETEHNPKRASPDTSTDRPIANTSQDNHAQRIFEQLHKLTRRARTAVKRAYE